MRTVRFNSILGRGDTLLLVRAVAVVDGRDVELTTVYVDLDDLAPDLRAELEETARAHAAAARTEEAERAVMAAEDARDDRARRPR
jgi:hypothetical protein